MSIFKKSIFIVTFFCLIVFLAPAIIFANPENADEMGGGNIEELRRLIEERNKEIEEIEKERARLEKELGEVSATASTLSKEINSIDHQINDLDFSIRKNNVTIDKLELELSALNEEIDTVEDSIWFTKGAMSRLLVELQKKKDEDMLVVLLKNESLAEGVSEIQSILSINQTLTGNVGQFLELKESLSSKLNQVEDNKGNTEVEQKTLVQRQNVAEDLKQNRSVLLSRTQSEARAYEQQIAEIEAQQQELYRVIAEMEEALRLAFDPTLLPTEIPGVLGWPLQETCVTQAYGETAFARVTYRTGYHNGVDFRARVPTAVFAVESGTVKAVDNNDRSTWQKYQYGKYVLIEHENNLTSLYSHLSSWTVSPGQRVERGSLIGYTGNTGFSTAPHLHFGVYWSPSVELRNIPPAAGLVPIGVDINPTGYLPSGKNGISCY